MTDRPKYLSTADLPEIIPIFPLNGVILLPHTSLPLNIFEPRYLAMTDHALATNRLIGMVQPISEESRMEKPEIYNIGGLGKIVNFSETNDGRYLISLAGLIRFEIKDELKADTPYRQVEAEYTEFSDDLALADNAPNIDRNRLLPALKNYLEINKMNTDWEAITHAPSETLINSLAMICPFDPTEKQALLEAKGLEERCDILSALLQMASSSGDPGSSIQ